MYAFNTLAIMSTSVIIQCFREGRYKFKCIIVMNRHNYHNKRYNTSYVGHYY